MPRFRIAASVASLAALVAIAASAQDERRVRVQVEEPTNDAAAVPEVDANAAANADEAGFYRASEVIGTQVKGEDGQSLGRINDLLIDGKSQQIRYFVLSDGDKVDANARTAPAAQSSSNLTVVPWSVARPQFGRTPDSRFVTVPFAQTRLREAPSYTWQEIQTAPTRWVPDVNRFYNIQGGGVAVPPDSRVRIQRDGDVKIKRDND